MKWTIHDAFARLIEKVGDSKVIEIELHGSHGERLPTGEWVRSMSLQVKLIDADPLARPKTGETR